jgi:hypothetical protein
MGRHHRKSRSRKSRGGALAPLMPANFSLGHGVAPQPIRQDGGSASSYVTSVVGDTNAQYNRVFNQGGEFGGVNGNTIIGTQGQGVLNQGSLPSSQQLAMAQSAGGRRKRGGFLGPALNQAAAPLALLALQQTYRKRRSHKSSRRSRRRSRRSRR